jgi:hypothetical protein
VDRGTIHPGVATSCYPGIDTARNVIDREAQVTVVRISIPIGILKTTAGMGDDIAPVVSDLRHLGYCPAMWVGVGILVPRITTAHLKDVGQKYHLRTTYHPYGIENVTVERLWYPPSSMLNPSWKQLRW